MERVLLTGGNGYIGSHIASMLIEEGYKVTIVDSLVNSSLSFVKNLKDLLSLKDCSLVKNFDFFKGDVRDEEFLENVFLKYEKEEKNSISGVIHLAGLKAVGESNTVPLLYWDNNIIGTINLLKIMEKRNCKDLIFSSSATIYGESDRSPINENHPINPTNPYGNTKALIEKLLNDVFNVSQNQWKIANLRYFNPVGAHSSGLIGENPLNKPNNIFPIIAKIAKNNKERLKIFGNNWNTPDGTCIRDYIHVMDVAEGHIKAYKYLKSNPPTILNLNLGTGKGTSVLELVEAYQKYNNVKIPYDFVERRLGDVAVVIANNLKAKELLDWSPSRDIQDMCKDSFRWEMMK